MKQSIVVLLTLTFLFSCKQVNKVEEIQEIKDPALTKLQEEVKSETLRSWNDYKKYAWGHDVLLPLSKSSFDWYEESLGISPIDAYSTLKVMGLDAEAKKIEVCAGNGLE